MRALITRATGALSSTITSRLLSQGWHVQGVDVLASESTEPDWIYVADITMPGAWEGLLDGIDLVIHVVSSSRETGDVQAKWDTNVLGTQRLFEAARRAAVKRAVLVSNTNVLGPFVRDGADEDYLGSTGGNIFSEVLLAAEHRALQAAALGLPVTIVRPSDMYGPGVPLWTTRVLDLLAVKQFKLPHGGKGMVRPTYITDVADGVITAATHDNGSGGIFNLVGPQALSTEAFFRPYARLAGVKLEKHARFVGRPLAATVGAMNKALGLPGELASDAMAFLTRPGTPSGERAAAVLDWQATITPEMGFAAIADWVRRGKPNVTLSRPLATPLPKPV
ncbi:NAD(P)-dependent oxidoreductase [Stomatohabitans albus]|uniref:NAD-dependent epimerase/dehydratase family protein n=1 Tax=Stomatohabitans albus TaxID=3110766 RepID=UPI00300C8195